MDDTYRRGPLLLLGGRANRPLAQEIGERIGRSPDGATIKNFADGEIFVRIDRNARGGTFSSSSPRRLRRTT